MKIDLCDGKYTYLINDDGSNQRALRYGSPWRNLVGDGFILAMAQEITKQKERIAELENIILEQGKTLHLYHSGKKAKGGAA